MQDTRFETSGPIVVGIGEALFDCFHDRAVLGGAPVNFAVHAHQLLAARGGRGVVVSRVGKDDTGRTLLHDLESRGVMTEAIQIDKHHPTGTVQVKVDKHGEPSYQISENVAWDKLSPEEPLELLASSCRAVCFGTLAQRSEPSCSTIQRFLSKANSAIRLLDVNLRQHFYTPEVLEASFAAASVAKLNLAELKLVCPLLMANKLKSLDKIDPMVRALQERFDLDCVAVTRGRLGTVLYDRETKYEAKPLAIERSAEADDVGAGDACAAGFVCGLLFGWTPAQTLGLANQLGAFVASRPGATPTLPQQLIKFASSNPRLA